MTLDSTQPPKPPETIEDAYKLIVVLWKAWLQLREENAALREENAALRIRVEELEEKLRTDSSNSSKPPSSDPPWKDKQKNRERNRRKRQRQRGGQPGHEGKTRELLPPEEIDHVVECVPGPDCKDCGGPVDCDEEPSERQQKFEIPEYRAEVTEYRIFSGECRECGRVQRGVLPAGVPAGILGPRAMAAVAVLSGKYRLSKRQVEEVLSDLLGLEVCLGTVSNTEARVSEALAAPVEEAHAYVKEQAVVHADETSHRVANQKAWLWTAVTSCVAVFLICGNRAADSAKRLLGEAFKGILVSDRWHSYSWVAAVRRQLCWAHLERDVTKLAERGGRSKEIGDAVLGYIQEMWHLWHIFRSGQRGRAWFRRKMAPLRAGVESLLAEGVTCGHARTQRTCKRILKLKAALWTFVETPGVEPTNNVAERTIRPYVLWRRVSFGTQSGRGSAFVERMMTVSATCKLQGRNVLDYVTAAIRAWLHGEASPSLLPDQAVAEVADAA
jgi:transposase